MRVYTKESYPLWVNYYTGLDMVMKQIEGQPDYFISGDWCEYCQESASSYHFHQNWKLNGVVPDKIWDRDDN